MIFNFLNLNADEDVDGYFDIELLATDFVKFPLSGRFVMLIYLAGVKYGFFSGLKKLISVGD